MNKVKIPEANWLNTIKVYDLFGKRFIIPDYQRGYRWNRKQVHDLLRDIQDFPIEHEDNWYCIQPLVVKPLAENEDEIKTKLATLLKKEEITLADIRKYLSQEHVYEVIDGQQRLTTLFILFQYLEQQSFFSIVYATRPESESYLHNIFKPDNPISCEKYIDFYHMNEVKEEIEKWFQTECQEKEVFKRKLHHVRFIWYETNPEEDAIEVFERLNIGKIALTNAELIKALFLNRYNFSQENDRFNLRQHEIALVWDRIECTLQNDEFWLFIHDEKWNHPTRIDFLFEIIHQRDKLDLQAMLGLNDDDYTKRLGNDKDCTFRYFYEYLHTSNNTNIAIQKCWDQVTTLFHILEEWYVDIKLYHYIGFLVEVQGEKKILIDLIDEWLSKDSETLLPKTKEQFTIKITERIKEYFRKKTLKSLRYGTPGIADALLLHNLQTVVLQNCSYECEQRYGMTVFYRFPFHLYKKERSIENKGWNVEHIDSASTNTLENIKEQKDWIKTAFMEMNNVQKEYFKDRVLSFLKIPDKFQELHDDINNILETDKDCLEENENVNINEKYAIWNLALLDSSTNKSYKNAIFPAKRRSIIGRDKGERYVIDDELNITTAPASITFIPPCTKNAFLKYYTPDSNNILTWSKHDAKLYLEDIKRVLKPFIKAE